MAGRQTKDQAELFRKRQSVLAAFGTHAFRTKDIGELLQRATELVSEAVSIDLVKILELQPDRKTMLIRAGVNWAPGVVGHASLGADDRSPGGYALKVREPVISLSVESEKRFDIPQLLLDHGVKSMVNVIIEGDREPFGVLEVDAKTHVKFSSDDIHFLKNYANIIAGALERCRIDEALAEAARTKQIIFLELQHRVKNMLMNILAVAGRTCSSSANLDEFMGSFTARLHAIARSQETLTQGAGDVVNMRTILTNELAAHGAMEGDKVVLAGDDVAIPGRDAWALSLLFHELMTNAQKYGALHVVSGKIAVSWSVDGESRLHLRWRESGATISANPKKKGFGSEIIGRAIPEKLEGTSSQTFHQDGFEYSLEFPLPSAFKPPLFPTT